MRINKLLLISTLCVAAAAFSVRAGDVKETWEKGCAKCHGPDGKGDTKLGKKAEVKDFSDAKYQDGLKDDAMFKAIKEGVKDGEKTKMKAAEGLTDDEIKALVTYVRTFKK